MSMEILEKLKISENSRIYRAKNRLKQSELGELCGISQMTVSIVERGVFRHVSDETLQRLSEIVTQASSLGADMEGK